MTEDITIRRVTHGDLTELHALIERAYRGDEARSGWTHEADIIREGERTSHDILAATIDDDNERLLAAIDGGRIIGCVQVSDRGHGTAYLGLLTVDPLMQAGGLGRRLIQAAEHIAVAAFEAHSMEMTVIDQRAELIAYYQRRGYRPTGERRAFPIELDPPLTMVVLEKPLD
ncbi:GNAT family N-acetyltransferase [Sphingomonas sp. SRS2]|uniref:GNAT family N-acetyltransferase n=1 Tax=Sphingomonas sp. SRS2 TaxID=133190 RepID=UPI00061845EF|nr:GNAT family N-acetyltransferase [Sphingomonas sp. SRS2]KKC25106.1 GCN5 family acetyltransferase [Sphingomonas sp. SRS2]